MSFENVSSSAKSPIFFQIFSPNEKLWSQSQIFASHVLTGPHSARVFRAQFLKNQAQIVTAGEDSILAIWDTLTGQCLRSWQGNDGSPIWSLASNAEFLFSGGGNGSLKMFSTCHQLSLKNASVEIHLTDLIGSTDYAKLVCFGFETDQNLVVLTKEGKCLQFSEDTG